MDDLESRVRESAANLEKSKASYVKKASHAKRAPGSTKGLQKQLKRCYNLGIIATYCVVDALNIDVDIFGSPFKIEDDVASRMLEKYINSSSDRTLRKDLAAMSEKIYGQMRGLDGYMRKINESARIRRHYIEIANLDDIKKRVKTKEEHDREINKERQERLKEYLSMDIANFLISQRSWISQSPRSLQWAGAFDRAVHDFLSELRGYASADTQNYITGMLEHYAYRINAPEVPEKKH